MAASNASRARFVTFLLAGLLAQQAGAAASDSTASKPQSVDLRERGAGARPIARETTVPKLESGPWHGPRLPDGQPDISGHWSNTIGNHNNFTDPQGPYPGTTARGGRAGGPRGERAPSRVSDPSDGQVPFQPWALEKVRDFQAHFNNPTRPEYIEPLSRCAPNGIPKSLYWYGYEIAQYPGYVVFFFNSGTRIVHLNGKPHLPDNIKLWNGDSRGHWEGNTLVVDVSNQNGKALFGRTGEFISESGRIVEKYIFADGGKRYNYVAVLTDPTVYTRPFTVTVPADKFEPRDPPDGWHYDVHAAKHRGKDLIIEHDERTCVEFNSGHAGGAAQ